MLLKNVTLNNFNTTTITKDTNLSTIKKEKNKFLEVVVPFDLFSLELLDQISANRIIITFDKQEQLQNQNHIFAQLISKKLYPFTKNVPFCHGNIEHAIEVFKRVEGPQKPQECGGCLLKKYCPFKGAGFEPKPITNKERYKDLLEFIENEDLTTRF